MNKNLLYYLLAITLVASCKRDDDHVFDKSPDERINETLSTYQTAITSSQYGWNANLITADGAPYRFYFSFTDSNRVQMYSDFDSTTATALKGSSYRLKALQQPSLIFDTYSYIHILSDPDGSVNGGEYGVGLKADFEFAIDTLAGDSISMTGRFNGSKLTLTKASQADRAVWSSKQVANGIVNFKNYWKFLNYWKWLNYGGVNYELQFDTTLKQVTVSWGAGNQAQSVTRGYYFWANGIYFTSPIINGSVNIPGFGITSFTNAAPADQVMNVTVNGTAATIKATSKTSLNPDVKNAITRWRNQAIANGLYWVSFDGFHKNGVDDAYNLKSLVNDSAHYYFLLYAPNSVGSDAFFNIYLDTLGTQAELALINGSWVRQSKPTAAGITKISEDSTRAAYPWPPSGPANDTRQQMYSGPNGYYFVQTSAITYDMVSADDPSVWISWTWVF